MAAQLGHGDFQRQSRAGRGLVEQEGHHLALEWQLGALPRLFAAPLFEEVVCGVQHRDESVAAKIRKTEEMACHLSFPTTCSTMSTPSSTCCCVMMSGGENLSARWPASVT